MTVQWDCESPKQNRTIAFAITRRNGLVTCLCDRRPLRKSRLTAAVPQELCELLFGDQDLRVRFGTGVLSGGETSLLNILSCWSKLKGKTNGGTRSGTLAITSWSSNCGRNSFKRIVLNDCEKRCTFVLLTLLLLTTTTTATQLLFTLMWQGVVDGTSKSRNCYNCHCYQSGKVIQSGDPIVTNPFVLCLWPYNNVDVTRCCWRNIIIQKLQLLLPATTAVAAAASTATATSNNCCWCCYTYCYCCCYQQLLLLLLLHLLLLLLPATTAVAAATSATTATATISYCCCCCYIIGCSWQDDNSIAKSAIYTASDICCHGIATAAIEYRKRLGLECHAYQHLSGAGCCSKLLLINRRHSVCKLPHCSSC